MATVGCAEYRGLNVLRTKIVVRPLEFLRVISQKSDWNIVFIKDRDSTLQLRDYGVVSQEAHLTRAAQVQSDVAHKLAIEIEMAETKVFPVAHQQERLIIPRIDG
jgi:hypothetical protein